MSTTAPLATVFFCSMRENSAYWLMFAPFSRYTGASSSTSMSMTAPIEKPEGPFFPFGIVSHSNFETILEIRPNCLWNANRKFTGSPTLMLLSASIVSLAVNLIRILLDKRDRVAVGAYD
jgi:hypothetical protein